MYTALWISGWLHNVGDVVRVTQERVRRGGVPLTDWRRWRIRSGQSAPAGRVDGPAEVAETPTDPQLRLPLEGKGTPPQSWP